MTSEIDKYKLSLVSFFLNRMSRLLGGGGNSCDSDWDWLFSTESSEPGLGELGDSTAWEGTKAEFEFWVSICETNWLKVFELDNWFWCVVRLLLGELSLFLEPSDFTDSSSMVLISLTAASICKFVGALAKISLICSVSNSKSELFYIK